MYMYILLVVVIVYIVLLNLITSYRLFRDDYYTTWQKSTQYLLVWSLPIVGSFIVIYFLHEEIDVSKKYPWIVRVVAGLFMLNLTKDAYVTRYSSSMNDNGGNDCIGFMETSCGDGGCGGD